jgi:outer membrane protein TolC
MRSVIPSISREITMSTMKKKFSVLSALALSLALMGGCATTASVQDAQSTADGASATANQAMSTADQALRTANDANRTATEANRKADAALEETARLREAMERMFERGAVK